MAKKKEEISNDKKKEIAFDLYMNTDMKQKEVAARVGTSETTMSKWVREGLWEELKSASTMTAQRIVSSLYQRMAAIVEDEEKVLDADKLVKIARSIELISNKKVTISQVINTFKAFTTFLFSKNVELAKQLNHYQKEYVEELINGN